MSAIVGLYFFNDQPVIPEELARMSARLAAHGPDGTGCWHHGAIGLAQRQMVITPEDRYERQPLASTDSQLVIVSDARLDNRPELEDELCIPPGEIATLPDSALILRAYEKWREDAPKHLTGDYTFALWDARRRQLLLVRSPLGNRPLYYIHTPHGFAFATMPSGLFALSWVPRTLVMENLLADDPNRTLYRGLKKVPAGHWLMVSQTGLQQRAFWQLDLERRLRFKRDEEYVEAFDELFTRAVQSRLRSLYPVGVSMSGGLDSASVAVTAARLLGQRGRALSTFTAMPPVGFDRPLGPGKYADETPFVQAMAEMHPNLCLHWVRTDGCNIFADVERFFAAMYAPFQNVSKRPWIEAMQAQAQAQGVRVLLNSAAGNLSVNWSGARALPELLRQGAWRQAWHAAYTQTQHPLAAGRALAGQGRWLRLPSHLQALIHHWRQPSQRSPFAASEIATALHPSLLQATHRHWWTQPPFPVAGAERRLRYAALLQMADSDYDAAYEARFGLSRRDPTSDLRLAEFCFAVPEEQWRHGQTTRSLLRRAMADRLPAAVLHNPKPGLQAAGWYEQLLAQRDTIQADLARLAQNATALHYLDLPRMRQLANTLSPTEWGRVELFGDYQWVLLGGLMIGRFILWFEATEVQGAPQ